MPYSAEDIETAARSLETRPASSSKRAWYLAIDESSDHPTVRTATRASLKAGIISGAGPVWNQRRERDDGSIGYAAGGMPRDLAHQLDWGKPQKHVSWPDTHVILWVVGLLNTHDVVFVSENLRQDNLGVRRLLSKHVAPCLDQSFSLVGYFKRGTTEYSEYCRSLAAFIGSDATVPGYQEIVV